MPVVVPQNLNERGREILFNHLRRRGLLDPTKDGIITEGFQGLGGALQNAALGVAQTVEETTGWDAPKRAVSNFVRNHQHWNPYKDYTALSLSPVDMARTVGTAIGGSAGALGGAAVGGMIGGPGGAAAGGFAAAMAQEFGPTLQEYRENLPDMSEDEVAGLAFVTSMAKSAIELLGPEATVAKSFGKAAAREAGEAAIKQFGKRTFGRLGKMALEGATETSEEIAQFMLDYVAQKANGANIKLDGRQLAESAVTGFVGGALLGGGLDMLQGGDADTGADAGGNTQGGTEVNPAAQPAQPDSAQPGAIIPQFDANKEFTVSESRTAVPGVAKAINAKSKTQLDDDAFLRAEPVGAAGKAVATLANKLGLDVEFVVPRIEEANVVNGVRAGNKIYVNVAGNVNPSMVVLGHEFTHDLKATSPELYQMVLDAVQGNEREGARDAYFERLRKMYEDAGFNLNDGVATEELVADLMGEFFGDPEFWNHVKNQQGDSFVQSLAKSVLRFFENIKRKLQGTTDAGSILSDVDRVMQVAAAATGQRLLNQRQGTVATRSKPTATNQPLALPQGREVRQLTQGGTFLMPESTVVHTMPDGTIMAGEEHEGAVPGSERVIAEPVNVEQPIRTWEEYLTSRFGRVVELGPKLEKMHRANFEQVREQTSPQASATSEDAGTLKSETEPTDNTPVGRDGVGEPSQRQERAARDSARDSESADIKPEINDHPGKLDDAEIESLKKVAETADENLASEQDNKLGKLPAGEINFSMANVKLVSLDGKTKIIPATEEVTSEKSSFKGVKKMLATEASIFSDLIDPNSDIWAPTEGGSVLEYSRQFFSEKGKKLLIESFDNDTAPSWVDDKKRWQQIKDVLDKVRDYNGKGLREIATQILGSNTKTGGYSLDFPLTTCLVTSNCSVCYAKNSPGKIENMAGARIKYALAMMLYPEQSSQIISDFIMSKSKGEMPFLRVNGSGDLTFQWQADLVNMIIDKIDRPVMIFSRSHVSRANGTVGLDSVSNGHYDPSNPQGGVAVYKLGSLDRQLVKYYVENYGYEFLRNNLKDRGIINSYLFEGAKDIPVLLALRQNGVKFVMHVNTTIDNIRALDKSGLLPTKENMANSPEIASPICACSTESGVLRNGCAVCKLAGGPCWAEGVNMAMTPDGKLGHVSDDEHLAKLAEGGSRLVTMSEVGKPSDEKMAHSQAIMLMYKSAAKDARGKIQTARRKAAAKNKEPLFNLEDPVSRTKLFQSVGEDQLDAVLAVVKQWEDWADLLEKMPTTDQVVQSIVKDVADKSDSINAAERALSNAKFSVRERDQAYMDAVERGDLDAAQGMVDEAAKAAGYDTKAYHGSSQDDIRVFKSVFDLRGRAQTEHDVLRFFTTNKNFADAYAFGDKTYSVYLNTANTWRASMREDIKDYVRYNADSNPSKFLQRLQQNNVDVIEFTEQDIDQTLVPNENHTVYGVVNPAIIKSADPVTRDDAGNVIPLSERFNPQSDDVRFSLSAPLTTVNPTGDVFSNYTPQQRAVAPLGDNITTLDVTSGKQPTEPVVIYRGAPAVQTEIVPGDFVTTNEQLARDYAGTGKVISKTVPMRDVLDDSTEPLGEEYIYRPAPERFSVRDIEAFRRAAATNRAPSGPVTQTTPMQDDPGRVLNRTAQATRDMSGRQSMDELDRRVQERIDRDGVERIAQQIADGEINLDATDETVRLGLRIQEEVGRLWREGKQDLSMRIASAWADTDLGRLLAMRKSKKDRQSLLNGAIVAPSKKARAKRKKAQKSGNATLQREFERLSRQEQARVQQVIDKYRARGVDVFNLTPQQLDDTRLTAQIVRDFQQAKASKGDMLYEYWVNAILSAPSTQATNILGNTVYAGTELTVQRAIEAGINLVAKRQGAATFGEFSSMLKALAPSFRRGWRNASQAFDTETPVFGQGAKDVVLETRGAIPDQVQIDGKNIALATAGKVFNKAGGGRTVRVPVRMLLAADEMAKTIIYALEGTAMAHRKAESEVRSGKIQKSEMQARIKELLQDPHSESNVYAQNRAVELTFQKDLGQLGQLIMAGRNIDGPVGQFFKFVLPFVKTPGNIIKTTVRKSPLGLLNMAYNGARGRYKGNADMAIKHAAEQVLVFGAMAWLMGATDDDEPVITGSVPPANARGERNFKYRNLPPTSIRLGDKWINYSRVEPFAGILTMLVDGLQAWRDADAGVDQDKIMGDIFNSVKSNIRDKTFLAGIGDIIEATENPRALSYWLTNFQSSWVPNAIRSGSRSLDPVWRDNYNYERGLDFWKEQLGRKALERAQLARPLPKIDLWGRDTEKDPITGNFATDALVRFASPVYVVDTSKTKPVENMILNWNKQNPNAEYWPSVPANYYRQSGKTFYMKADQYHRFAQRAGRMADKVLSDMVRRGELNVSRPTEEDVEKMKNVFRKVRRQAREEVVNGRRQAGFRF